MSKKTVLQSIKRMCSRCRGDHPHAVKNCKVTPCPLFPYRTGHDPDAGHKLTPAQRVAIGERLFKARRVR